MAALLPKLRSLEQKWELQGKTKAQKRRLRYYYRHQLEILEQNKSPFKDRDAVTLR